MFINILHWVRKDLLAIAEHFPAWAWRLCWSIASHGKLFSRSIMYHHLVLNLSSPAHVVAASGSDKQSHFHMSEGKQVNYWWCCKGGSQQVSLRGYYNSATSWASTAVHWGPCDTEEWLTQGCAYCCNVLLSPECLPAPSRCLFSSCLSLHNSGTCLEVHSVCALVHIETSLFSVAS